MSEINTWQNKVINKIKILEQNKHLLEKRQEKLFENLQGCNRETRLYVTTRDKLNEITYTLKRVETELGAYKRSWNRGQNIEDLSESFSNLSVKMTEDSNKQKSNLAATTVTTSTSTVTTPSATGATKPTTKTIETNPLDSEAAKKASDDANLKSQASGPFATAMAKKNTQEIPKVTGTVPKGPNMFTSTPTDIGTQTATFNVDPNIFGPGEYPNVRTNPYAFPTKPPRTSTDEKNSVWQNMQNFDLIPQGVQTQTMATQTEDQPQRKVSFADDTDEDRRRSRSPQNNLDRERRRDRTPQDSFDINKNRFSEKYTIPTKPTIFKSYREPREKRTYSKSYQYDSESDANKNTKMSKTYVMNKEDQFESENKGMRDQPRTKNTSETNNNPNEADHIIKSSKDYRMRQANEHEHDTSDSDDYDAQFDHQRSNRNNRAKHWPRNQNAGQMYYDESFQNQKCRTTYLKRLVTIPELTGETFENLKLFLEKVDTLFYSAMNDAEICELYEQILLKINGEARDIVMAMGNLDWENIKKSLLDHFSHLCNRNLLTSQLENLKQERDESLEKYTERARKLLRTKNAMYSHLTQEQKSEHNRTAARAFMNGIKDYNLRNTVKTRGATSLETAIENAIDMQSDAMHSIARNELFCRHCKTTGHREADCRRRSNNENNTIFKFINALRSVDSVNFRGGNSMQPMRIPQRNYDYRYDVWNGRNQVRNQSSPNRQQYYNYNDRRQSNNNNNDQIRPRYNNYSDQNRQRFNNPINQNRQQSNNNNNDDLANRRVRYNPNSLQRVEGGSTRPNQVNTVALEQRLRQRSSEPKN